MLHPCVLSCFSQVQLFVTLWTLACQAPLSMGFSRQVYWSGLPCLPTGDLPNPGIKPESHVWKFFSKRLTDHDTTYWYNLRKGNWPRKMKSD